MLPLKLQVDIGAQLKVSYEEETRKFKCHHCNDKLTLAPNLKCHTKMKRENFHVSSSYDTLSWAPMLTCHYSGNS